MDKEATKLLSKIRRQQMAALNSAPHMRPYSRHGDSSKAIEYARWLAERDGLPTHGLAQAVFIPVPVTGYKSPETRATAVYFGDTKVRIPHFDFDPNAPAIDCSDEPFQMAAE